MSLLIKENHIEFDSDLNNIGCICWHIIDVNQELTSNSREISRVNSGHILRLGPRRNHWSMVCHDSPFDTIENQMILRIYNRLERRRGVLLNGWYITDRSHAWFLRVRSTLREYHRNMQAMHSKLGESSSHITPILAIGKFGVNCDTRCDFSSD